MCKENNIYLIDNTSKIKAQHLNKGKLHLSKRGSNVLSSSFGSELFRILTWKCDKNNTGFPVEESNQKVTDGNRVLKSLSCNNLNKLAFARRNINSIRNKFELIPEQVRGNADVLMVSETKIDGSFPNEIFLIHGFISPNRLDRNSKGILSNSFKPSSNR